MKGKKLYYKGKTTFLFCFPMLVVYWNSLYFDVVKRVIKIQSVGVGKRARYAYMKDKVPMKCWKNFPDPAFVLFNAQGTSMCLRDLPTDVQCTSEP